MARPANSGGYGSSRGWPDRGWELCPSHVAIAKAGHALSAVRVAAMSGSRPLAKRAGAGQRSRWSQASPWPRPGPSPAPPAASPAAAGQRQSSTAPPSTVSTVPVTKRLSIR